MLIRRITAAFIAVGALVLSGCGPNEEAPLHGGIDISFDNMGDFTVSNTSEVSDTAPRS